MSKRQFSLGRRGGEPKVSRARPTSHADSLRMTNDAVLHRQRVQRPFPTTFFSCGCCDKTLKDKNYLPIGCVAIPTILTFVKTELLILEFFDSECSAAGAGPTIHPVAQSSFARDWPQLFEAQLCAGRRNEPIGPIDTSDRSRGISRLGRVRRTSLGLQMPARFSDLSQSIDDAWITKPVVVAWVLRHFVG